VGGGGNGEDSLLSLIEREGRDCGDLQESLRVKENIRLGKAKTLLGTICDGELGPATEASRAGEVKGEASGNLLSLGTGRASGSKCQEGVSCWGPTRGYDLGKIHWATSDVSAVKVGRTKVTGQRGLPR